LFPIVFDVTPDRGIDATTNQLQHTNRRSQVVQNEFGRAPDDFADVALLEVVDDEFLL
jgi:hypothetical protein